MNQINMNHHSSGSLCQLVRFLGSEDTSMYYWYKSDPRNDAKDVIVTYLYQKVTPVSLTTGCLSSRDLPSKPQNRR